MQQLQEKVVSNGVKILSGLFDQAVKVSPCGSPMICSAPSPVIWLFICHLPTVSLFLGARGSRVQRKCQCVKNRYLSFL